MKIFLKNCLWLVKDPLFVILMLFVILNFFVNDNLFEKYGVLIWYIVTFNICAYIGYIIDKNKINS